MSDFLSFRLADDFVKGYKSKKVEWGFDIGGGNSLSELTFINKYSRKKDNGTKERWYEVCRRCVEGTYSILKDHAKFHGTPWNEMKAQKSAKDAYDRMFQFKWMPPGRGLQHAGTKYIMESRNSARLINCAALSTEKISPHSAYDSTMPFVRLMEMSMNGVGVGIDSRGAGNITLHQPLAEKESYVIEDTREAWAQSLGALLETFFFKNRKTLDFDYSKIRPEGAELKSFGGTASGPGPLMRMHEKITKLLDGREGQKLTSRDIIDIANLSGKAAVAGGSRRSALISFGFIEDDDFVNLKNWELPENAERTGPDGWAWASNNSILANIGDDLSSIVDKIAINGEPGILWVDAMQKYGRMENPPDFKDHRANLTNPCQPAWATVWTPDGISTIGQISVGDKIWSESGWTTVLDKWSTGVKDVKAYYTSAGVFYGTKNHKVVSNGVKLEVKDAICIDALLGPEDYSEASQIRGSFEVLASGHYSTEEVYDITVDNDSHTYWSGGLNVSNCGEISLESSELCNLSELFPTNHDSVDDFKKTIKHAYMYSKAVTLMSTPWGETNEVIMRNRRIGVSMTGVAQFVEGRGWPEMRLWMDEGYKHLAGLDKTYSEWLGVRESIKVSTVKPAGSTSLIAGVTPGVHWPTTSDYHIRRVRYLNTDPMLDLLTEAGYHVEPDVNDPNMTAVVSFPTKGIDIRSEREVSIWEKGHLAALAQRFWSDNLVSCTLSFREEERDQLIPLLSSLDGQLKSASFLPIDESGTSYKQAPYEPLEEDKALEWMAEVSKLPEKKMYKEGLDFVEDRFCTTDTCTI